MGYRFVGFFAQAGDELLEAAGQQWPGVRRKRIRDPFIGIGVASPEIVYADTYEDWERAIEVAFDIEDGLPDWSNRYPDVLFVFIDEDCFGGTCLCEGYACRNGAILERADSDGALDRLVAHLGVKLRRGYFAPFRRGYFDG